jgi:signal transduction histidine kinase
MTAVREADLLERIPSRGRWKDRIALWAPPIRQPQFWVVQLLVLSIAGAHTLIETTEGVDLGHANFIPVSLFLLPVIYAGLAFGLRGSAPTALWCAALTIPNALLWHPGEEAYAELWQAGLVVAVGIFIGQRIDRERAARIVAERRQRDQQASENKYRTVFDSAGDAILLVNGESVIFDANAAACQLLGKTSNELRGKRLQHVASGALAEVAKDSSSSRVIGPLTTPDRPPQWLMPVHTQLQDASGRDLSLLLLRDVSLQVERQQLLEGFAAQTLAAREAERRRIARDLHDGPIQSLVHIWRSLDQIEVEDDATQETIAAARTMAEQVSAELRRVSRELRPSVLDDLGLTAALKAETAAFEHRSGIRTRYAEHGNPDELTGELQLAVLRVCQEALHNVERHAGASSVSVAITVAPTGMELAVADNGRGIMHVLRPSDLVAAGKLGLVGMQERARLVGGMCEVSGSPSGTTVRFTAPAGRNPQASPH